MSSLYISKDSPDFKAVGFGQYSPNATIYGGSSHLWSFTVIFFLLLTMWMLEQVDGQVRSLLIYDRPAILDGEVWRLLSGSLLHTNRFHLALNSAALVGLWILHGQYCRPLKLVIIVLLLAISCGLGLLFFEEQIEWYLGFSGVLHGLLVLGAVRELSGGRLAGYALLIAIVIKLLSERYLFDFQPVSSLIQARVVVEAHFWGAVAAMLLIVSQLLASSFRYLAGVLEKGTGGYSR